MLNLQSLSIPTLNLDFREKREGLYKALVPFFHEDGDMYDMFIEECPTNNRKIRLTDKGLTLMKLSYTFDIDTDNKRSVFSNIIAQNRCREYDGEIYLDCNASDLQYTIYQFAQTISKVTNMEILTREIVKSLFYDNLQSYIYENDFLKQYQISANVAPLTDRTLKADYAIQKNDKIIYLFGVNDNNKASRVIITCLKYQRAKLPHRSLVIHENFDSLSGFNRNQITDIVDKQFTSFDVFKEGQRQYFEREFESVG